MYLVCGKRISDICWKLLDWTVFIILIATCAWFQTGVIKELDKERTAISPFEEKIEAHPTIVICGFTQSWEYGKIFAIAYSTYGSSVEDQVVLKMGENNLEHSGENVNLRIIYTYDGMCYSINTTRNVDEGWTKIKIWSSHYVNNDVYFTSEENSYGATTSDWRDGDVYSFSISSGTRKKIALTVEKNINVKWYENLSY